MAFVVNETTRTAGGRAGPVFELMDAEETVRAEVWPAWGFNCLRWQVRQPDGNWGDVLYTAPDWEANPVPTRSGHPILFPFPGRLREGKFTFMERVYQLPLTDSAKQNAIHGFTPRNKWRVADSNGDDDFAFITGEFSLRKDLPAELGDWPADFTLSVTYKLYRDRLMVTATVANTGRGPLPFGLGYHPYFRLPDVPDPDIAAYVLQANAGQIWETDDNNLPTGWRKDVPGDIDFRYPFPIAGTVLDNVYTDVKGGTTELGGLVEMASLSHPAAARRLVVLADPAFRELVLFTPPHRQAVAIEPYTCSADAANYWDRGVDCGWQVIQPGREWEAGVEYRLEPV